MIKTLTFGVSYKYHKKAKEYSKANISPTQWSLK